MRMLREADVQLLVRGDVGQKMIDYARQKVVRALGQTSDPVLFSRLKLAWERDPARERPAIAQCTVDLNGRVLRAHVAGHDMQEAADLLEARLRDQLEHLADRREALRTRGPGSREPGEWRRGDPPAHRPPHYDRPPEEREIVRRKTFALRLLTPAEAAEEMALLDYDFHLFTDRRTGLDSLVYRRRGGEVEVSTVEALADGGTPAPAVGEDEAVRRLNLTAEPFLFFRDEGSGRGAVVYRRYDGHYGVITAGETTVPRT